LLGRIDTVGDAVERPMDATLMVSDADFVWLGCIDVVGFTLGAALIVGGSVGWEDALGISLGPVLGPLLTVGDAVGDLLGRNDTVGDAVGRLLGSTLIVGDDVGV